MDSNPFFNYPGQEPADEGMIFLENCVEEDWAELLSYMQSWQFHAGDILIEKGDTDRACYFIDSGNLEVLIPVPYSSKLHQLTVLSAGSVLGEQGFLDGQPRSATIRATTDGMLFRLSRDSFDSLAVKNPQLAITVLADLGRIISLRLRQITSSLSQDLV